jgi:Na+/phosphate symporter
MYLSAIVCIVGLVIYYIAKEAKNTEIGRMMFWVGLLAFLLGSAETIQALVIKK